MKEKKGNMVGVKLSDSQVKILDDLIANGVATSRSSAIQYLIKKQAILGSK